jgi:hypothetical protein
MLDEKERRDRYILYIGCGPSPCVDFCTILLLISGNHQSRLIEGDLTQTISLVTEHNSSVQQALSHRMVGIRCVQAVNRNASTAGRSALQGCDIPKNDCSYPKRCITHSIQTTDTVQYSNYDTNNIERAKAKISKKENASIKDKKSGWDSNKTQYMSRYA